MTSLFELEKSADVDKLTSLVSNSNSEAVRRRAAEILGDVDGPDQIIEDALVKAAQNDPDEGVRAAAIDALDQRHAVEKLIDALSDEEVATEGAEWARAEALVGSLTAELPELRMASANALGRVGNRAGTKPLVERLGDPDPRVRARAARALGRIGDPRAVSALRKCLRDERVEVRREAADSLGRIGGGEALDALLGLLDDDSETVRRIAATSMGNFGSAKPLDALVSLLTDESEAVRRAAVFSLIEILSNAPGQKSHQLRQTMVEKLSANDHRSVVTSLVDILEQGTQPHQRRNAAWLLGRVTGEENREAAVEALVSVLDDDDGMASQFAATSIANVGGEVAEDALLDVLDDPEAGSDARAKAAFTLGKVGGERARDRLDSLIDRTDDEEVRKRAFSALSKLGGRG
ncbi:HEAT repeat domain-containing protein [Halorussus salilacus]|uniref:HEAT repeat domain-containing protein n=1 Tax=Halorussus salilacus TaxID=2953750 RepID=UPI0020A0F426|nr:HEAT repeat domain-containing protein [Halorussus salilacus]USZ68113.1 HEAT repeat domain-containing protein [Halorussus salilacus]